MNMKDQEKIKKQILGFTSNGVEKFLKENPNLEFYAFAFDCNAEDAAIGLCFNTEQDFQKILQHYQSGDYSKYYQTEQEIKELKYNTGDWEYQCFENLDIYTNEELTEIFQKLPDDDTSWNEFVSNLLELFTQSLFEFTKTETYTKIPKTKDFIVFCIDHDEDFEEAIERMNKYR